MKYLIYLSLSFIFLLFFNSCTSLTGGDSIVIEQMDLSGDFSLEEFNKRIQTRSEQYGKLLEFKKNIENFSGYENLIKKEDDNFKKAKFIELANILPANLDGNSRRDIYECVGDYFKYRSGINIDTDCYSSRFRQTDGRHTTQEFVYMGETSYCKDTCKNCCFNIFRTSPSFSVSVFVTNLINANMDMEKRLLEKISMIGRIEASNPKKNVIIQEVTLDLPNTIEIGKKLDGLVNKDSFGNHVDWDFPPKYYGLIIQINYRVYIVAEVYSKANYSTEPRTYPEFKDPKEFDATVKAVKALKDNLDYSKIIELTTPQ